MTIVLSPGVAAVKDLSLNKIGRYVAVSVARPVVREHDSGTIKVQRLFLIEDLGGNRACGRWWEGEVPIFHPRGGCEMFPRVFVSENGRSISVHPRIAVSVIEVPMRVDEIFDRPRIHLSESVGNPGARGRVTGVDNHFAVCSNEDGDVSARADKSTHISAQGLHGDAGGFGTFARRKHDVFTFGEKTPWREAGSRGEDSRRRRGNAGVKGNENG